MSPSSLDDLNAIRAGSSRTFRLGRHVLGTGIVGATLFPVIGLLFTLAALWNIDGSFPRPRTAALVNGIFWSFWTVLSLWLIGSWIRTRLGISETEVRWQGVLSDKTIRWSEVQRARWCLRGSRGALKLRDGRARIALRFDDLERSACPELVHFCRSSLPDGVQENWSRFEEFYFSGAAERRRIAAKHSLIIAAVLGGVAALLGIAGICPGPPLLRVGVPIALAVTSIFLVMRLQRARATD